MTTIHIGAKVDEGEFARAMANRNCKTPSELLQLLIKEAARAPPKRDHKKKPVIKSSHLKMKIDNVDAAISPTIINDMKFLLLDRDKRGQVCTREWFTKYIKENYPLESSVDLKGIVDTIFTII